MKRMTIGEFGQRTRLSPKALRLYEQLGLIVPVEVQAHSGYRFYDEDQIAGAQLVGLLRRLNMPLAMIGSVLASDPERAAALVTEYWQKAEHAMEERRHLLSYVHARLTGATPAMYDIAFRTMPTRSVLAINRHVHVGQIDGFFDEAFGRLRSAGPGLTGIEGAPFLIFYGEVSDDSDGPVELCRPVADATASGISNGLSDMQIRVEPTRDEIFVRLPHQEATWPEMLPVVDALMLWSKEHQREPAGPLRQYLIADRRTATPEALVIELTVPLR